MVTGVLVILVGIGLLVERAAFHARAEIATGTVVARNYARSTGSSGGGSGTYRPTFVFQDTNGTEHRARAHIGSSNFDWPKGAQVQIRYDPADPLRVRPVVPFFQAFMLHFFLLVFGTAFAVAGWVTRRAV